jgi:predicted GNAT family acetyltransferase
VKEKDVSTETGTPEIRRETSPRGGRYVTLVEGHEAELTYYRDGEGRIVIDHTGVPQALGGRGIGLALLKRAVEDARAESIKIVPACSYAAAQIARRPELQDVLAK